MSLKTLLTRLPRHTRFSSVISVVKQKKYEEYHESKSSQFNKITTTTILGTALIAASFKDKENAPKSCPFHKKEAKPDVVEAGSKLPNIPTYRADEVAKHNTRESFWVIYKNGVYDVTKFLSSHPGGDQILNAGGLSIEPFWNVYGMHKTEEVFKLLEQHRIGNLHDDDVVDHSDEEMWVKEPFRDNRLIVKTKRPFNAETPPDALVQSLDTPNELFYVRQHMPVPDLDPLTHKITLKVVEKGKVVKSKVMTLSDLDKFPKATVRAALMCAGNRRSEMNKVKEVKGLSWTTGAISNAVWEGVYLRDILEHFGVDLNDVEGKHVICYGADIDATGEQFSTSIPLRLANRSVVARSMNGAALGGDHGAPARLVVPGAAAVRSVKWIESIVVSDEESPSHWHRRDYRSFSPSVTWDTADWENAPPVYFIPVTSAICQPLHGSRVQVENGKVTVKGYAYSGGGAKIIRVDVKAAGGEWQSAELETDDAPPGEHYAWTLWTVDLPVKKNQKTVEICVKATDSNMNTQPERFEDIWNIRGILSNAYHKIKVELKH